MQPPLARNYTISDTNGCVDEGNVTVFPPLGECGCNEPNAVNYNPSATSNDRSCEFTNPCPADLSNDGVIGLQDLLVVLSGFGLSVNDMIQRGRTYLWSALLLAFVGMDAAHAQVQSLVVDVAQTHDSTSPDAPPAGL